VRVLFSQGLISISKPRCGSTSVRRILDRLVDKSKGDIAVDVAGQRPPYHPHHSAPYLKQLLMADGYDIAGMTTVIITRNPVDMLWSYFNYFKPDSAGRYNYNTDWNNSDLMPFEDWVLYGRVGMNNGALQLAPDWISTTDLTPLNLEAHIDTRDGRREVDLIFRLEEIQTFIDWLAERTGAAIAQRHVNHSNSSEMPVLRENATNKIRQMFPLECEMYGV
jgi:hypothetical protein